MKSFTYLYLDSPNRLIRWVVSAIIPLFILSLFLPYIFTRVGWLGIDFTQAGPIGDTIGGIMGPAIGLLGAVLAFVAFYAQIDASNQLKGQFILQQYDNQFYRYITIIKELADEIKLEKKYGIAFGLEAFSLWVSEGSAYSSMSYKILVRNISIPYKEDVKEILVLSDMIGAIILFKGTDIERHLHLILVKYQKKYDVDNAIREIMSLLGELISQHYNLNNDILRVSPKNFSLLLEGQAVLIMQDTHKIFQATNSRLPVFLETVKSIIHVINNIRKFDEDNVKYYEKITANFIDYKLSILVNWYNIGNIEDKVGYKKIYENLFRKHE